mgnify:CR=1 FL=1
MDLDYLKKAYEIAIQYSTDKSTQNGALLVSSEGEILCSAANNFPSGVKETLERWERPTKYSFVEHAERNVIYKAAKFGIKTEGLTMYCPWFACADCGRAIIQAGIKKVIGHEVHEEHTHKSWLESIAIASKMFDEAGIEYKYVSGRIGLNILRNGHLIEV